MDPITQAAAGSIAAQIFSKQEHRRTATWVGALSGMAADLDIFIQSSSDPTLALIYHRHFTHSLLFIPVGGLFCALVLWLVNRRQKPFQVFAIAAVIGYATHGVIDALTSYGTMLYWPFSHQRVAWDAISIIDPLFTLTLIIGILWTRKTLDIKPALIALSLGLFIIVFGFFQNYQLIETQQKIAQQRGHVWKRGRVFPTFANMFLWRSVYESEGRFYVDALRKLPGEDLVFWEAGSVKKVKVEDLLLDSETTLKQDLQIFAWFADDYLFEISDQKNTIGDFRYSMQPMGLIPLWGAKFNPKNPQRHVKRINFFNDRGEAFKIFWELLWKERSGFQVFSDR